jgi:hypothetical protein
MKTTLSPLASDQPQKVTIDWAQSEWFEVWLRLAKRDYQGDPAADQKSPSWIAQAAAA